MRVPLRHVLSTYIPFVILRHGRNGTRICKPICGESTSSHAVVAPRHDKRWVGLPIFFGGAAQGATGLHFFAFFYIKEADVRFTLRDDVIPDEGGRPRVQCSMRNHFVVQ